jgi:hypothetical protein
MSPYAQKILHFYCFKTAPLVAFGHRSDAGVFPFFLRLEFNQQD